MRIQKITLDKRGKLWIVLLVDVNQSQQSIFKTDDSDVVTEPDSISNSFNTLLVNIGPKLASAIKKKVGKNYFEYLLA